ncbi:MAG TPA: CYTH and CHAD domain-containing protein [Propionicimonas sp.]
MATQVEHERKFALGDGQQVPDLSEVADVGPTAEFDLVATYYDSPDFRLAAARQVIRRRTGGNDDGWHLKRPGAEPDQRTELHAPVEHSRPPQQFRDVVAGSLGGAPLVPVAELRTHRVERQLMAADGTVLAVLCTDQVDARAGVHTQRWREAEVELVDGDAGFLDRVTSVLQAAGVQVSESASKAAQALAPAIADAAAADRSAGGAVLAYVGAQIGVLQAHEEAVRRDGPDAVHRSRVATRRVRSALRTFGGVFEPGAVQHVRDELRWHAELLGGARDTEVLQERLTTALEELAEPAGDAVIRRVTSSLAEAHAVAHGRLVQSMSTERYEALQLELEQLLVAPGLVRVAAEEASAVLPPMLGVAVGRVRKLARRAAAQPGDLRRWHEVRKAAKAVRYGSEALVGALGGTAENWRARWEQVTECFGAVQDCVVAAHVIEDLASQTVVEGLPRAPFDALLAHQDTALREALARGREALATALEAHGGPETFGV